MNETGNQSISKIDSKSDKLKEQLELEMKIYDGFTAMLKVYENTDYVKEDTIKQVKLQSSNKKIDSLKSRLKQQEIDGGTDLNLNIRMSKNRLSTETIVKSISTSNIVGMRRGHTRTESADQSDYKGIKLLVDSESINLRIIEIMNNLNSANQNYLPDLNGLVEHLKIIKRIETFYPIENALKIEVRAATIRVLRYIIQDDEALKFVILFSIDILIYQSLFLDNRHDLERSQALNFVQHLLTIGNKNIPRLLIMGVVSISENLEDNMHQACLVILAEMAIRHPQLAASTNAINSILKNSLKGSEKLFEIPIFVSVYLLDFPQTRLYLRQSVEFGSLPELFEMAASFFGDRNRHLATSALTHIDSVFQFYSKNAVENVPKFRQQGHFDPLKFRALINDSQVFLLFECIQVLVSKDYREWDWNVIVELLQGYLQNSKRVKEVIQNTKFIKRLLSFLRPSNKQFSKLSSGEGTGLIVKCCLELINILASSTDDGVPILMDNSLFQEISIALEDLDPIKGSVSQDHMFSSNTRLYATKEMLRIGNDYSDFDWGIELLVNQLFDTSIEVSKTASFVLSKLSVNHNCLDILISQKPPLHLINNISSELIL
ncbi:hypothetical protein O9G_005039 [Rozella allomycis CSF55]|uniref:Uncharacterized protein n=1 Tax=Rozella allomycis (strain CSF55) TaxID=988480 RepID=A0A075B3B9_ROZAC|nr:hypothetical protein O9G_005039 [Rozella allomycis CSF55]|eukprot:EPZ37073.1 hypothetical protein O9G_005039 [Rozella allomycis CSF55]